MALSHDQTPAVYLTPVLETKATLLLRDWPFRRLCCRLVVTRNTAVTCFAHPPVIEWPPRWSCWTQGEAFKNTVIIFESNGQRFLHPWSVQLFLEPIQWVDTLHYLGVTRHTRLSWSSHINYVRKLPKGCMYWVLPWTGEVVSTSAMGVLLYKQLPWWTTSAPHGDSQPTCTSGGCRYYGPNVFAMLPVYPGTLVAGRFTRICEFLFLLNTLEP